MKKLLKLHGLNSDMQYLQMIADRYIDGQKAQAKAQFKVMPKVYRQLFLTNALTNWNSGLSNEQLATFIELL